MAGIYKYILLRRTAAYNSVVELQSIRSRQSVVKAHVRCPTKGVEKKRYTKIKRKALRALNPRPRFIRECNLLLSHPFPHMTCLRLICIYTYYMNTHVGYFGDKNENSTPRRETTRARPRPPPAESGETSMVRHAEQTPHRTVNLISSQGIYGPKPGLSLTSRLLRRHGQHIYTYIY